MDHKRVDFQAELCNAPHLNIPNSWLLFRFRFCVVILCYSLSMLNLTFWEYFVLYFISVCVLLLS